MARNSSAMRSKWVGGSTRTFCVLCATASALLAAEQPKVDFEKQIQPIFIKRCFECHGPDKQKSGLRLDRRADALKGGKSGKPLLVAGKSAESELIHRVTTQDADDVMPAKGDRLTAEQISSLKAWIDQGAIWPDEKKHWSFVKPVRSKLPPVQKTSWPKNEIDHFILAKLEQEKLTPSHEAERSTLLRRLSF